MKLLNKIDKINEDIQTINNTIYGLLNEQATPNPWLWWFRRKCDWW